MMDQPEQGRVIVKARPTLVPAEEALGDCLSILSTGQGRIATIFAYGQTGSGKTHTVQGSKDTPGLVHWISDDLLAHCNPLTSTVSVSIEEQYNEKCTDLLAALPRRAALQASRAAPTHSVELNRKGISSSSSSSNTGPLLALEEKIVRSSKQLKELVQSALRKRKTSATALNYNSSRWHVIITITVQQRKRIGSIGAAGVADGDGGSSPASSPGASRRCSSSGSVTAEGSSTALESPRSEGDAAGSKADDGLDGEVFTHLTGKLYLVDLAGSESIKDSGAEGQQRVEACNINKSLSHLKTVISQWLKGRVATYRESLLTRRLQHALGGGKSKLLVIACISTARGNLAQTKATLHFAQMARAIKNTPTVNRELKGETVTRLQLQESAAAAAAAAVAEGGQTAAGSGSSWPSVYRPERELASAAQRTAAQRAFDELAPGTVVKLETLQTFLKGKELGGEPHSNRYSMPGDKRKRRKLKHHLVQDMLAYHQHAMLQLRSRQTPTRHSCIAGSWR
ncbi:hypothetical protein OEZ85_011481 [Tetradesmus obliquus]|uniref:Kinesin-like protein n=1 Tax=Tetradesmus obliquus TaxID=3088 RepID=A0ABY8TQU4_TETOB|nr:hypothetical protein OEZ85_011481 [Tetradesmus obliquus]